MAYDHLLDHDDGGPGIAVLITDGAPNCAAGAENLAALLEAEDAEAEATISAAFLDDGIPTLVIGVHIADGVSPTTPDMEPDGVSPREIVGALAHAGGAAEADPVTPYYDLDALVDGPTIVDAIFGGGRTGLPAVELDPPAPASMTLEVRIGGQFQPALGGDSCGGGDGWIFASAARDIVVFCGAAEALWDATGSATITYVCP